MTIRVLCLKWKQQVLVSDVAVNSVHHCQSYEPHRKRWNGLLVRQKKEIEREEWSVIVGFISIRFGIFAISIGNKESLVAKRNHINRYGTSVVRAIIS